jgi:prepilin-type N-terminal cleavage/methylation domain-containing protein
MMATASYPIRSARTHRRGLTLIEFVLAVSVMGGLAFVSFRIMNMTVPQSRAQTQMTGSVAGARAP